MEYDLLLKRLRDNATKNPTKLAASFVLSGGTGTNDAYGGKLERQITYEELEHVTNVLAMELQTKHKISRGQCAVLVYPPSLDYSIAFLSCLKAGIVAVPVFPPNPTRRDTLKMFTKIVESSGARHALTSSSYQHQKKLAGIRSVFRTLKSSSSSSSWPEDLQWIVTSTTLASSWKKNAADDEASNVAADRLPDPQSSDLAFLQYTSGSTSDPKGVMITHANLGHNLTIITRDLQAQDDTIVVSWLPQYHDMGLIGSFLGILYCGGSGYYLSPLAFLQRPMIWLEAVSAHRATHLQAPNFAFGLAAKKFSPQDYRRDDNDDKNAGNGGSSSSSSKPILDLSSVRHVINAAEPVTEECIESFLGAFRPYGFDPNAMFPTYGLAEHTVFVCSGGTQRLTVSKERLELDGIVEILPNANHVDGNDDEKDNGGGDDGDDGSGGVVEYTNGSIEVTTPAATSTTDHTSRLIGCGYPSRQGVDVKIVDHDTCEPLQDHRVGEIWIRSPSKAAGYYRQPEESASDFHARLSSSSAAHDHDNNDDNDYLRTGDLGFFHNDELFICGRLKDLIIIGGRNYYPQDLEATAEASSPDTIRPGCSAAFTIDPARQRGEEVALLVELRDVPKTTSKQKVREACEPLARSIHAAVTKDHSLGLAEIVLLRTRTVPKTTSGKIARSWCRKAYLSDTLQVVYRQSFRTTQESQHEERQTNGGNGSIMAPMELEMEGGAATGPPRSAVPTEEDIAALRAMDRGDIIARLKRDVAKMGAVPDDGAIDAQAPLSTVLDSLNLSQFKGLLESEYAVNISDDYLFRDNTTLHKLAEVVRLGYAPDDDNNDDDNNNNGEGDGSRQKKRSGGGLSGALGCPPGVYCVIL